MKAPLPDAAPTWACASDRAGDVAFSWRIRRGTGGAPPLVLVHGIGPGTTGQINFAPLLARLSASHDVHVIDLIGFGGAIPPGRTCTFDVDLWIEQIGRVLDHAGPDAVLIGNSVGGALALRVAARHPALRGVLVIGAPAGQQHATPALRAFWSAPADRAALAAAMRPMTADCAIPSPMVVEARWQAAGDSARRAAFAAMRADPDACLRAAALPAREAAAIRVPLRILHGLRDRACPPGPMARLVLDHMPHADLVLLGDCGHAIMSERAADVDAALSLLLATGYAA